MLYVHNVINKNVINVPCAMSIIIEKVFLKNHNKLNLNQQHSFNDLVRISSAKISFKNINNTFK